ncbi:MAG: site-specific integrase, partial [Planctomycetota bacterium]
MGRIYKPKYTVKGPDGVSIQKETEAFHMEWTDSCGRTRRRKAGLTAAAAKDALRQAESEVLAEKNGLPTRKAGEIATSELLAAYLQALRQRATPAHVANVETAIENVISATHCAFLKDLKPESMEAYLAGLQDAGNLSARTMNTPLVAVKGMLNWAVKTRRIPFNPLACIQRMTGEKTRNRRTLSEIEIGKLLAAAMEGPTRRARRSRENRPRKNGTFKRVEIKLHIQAQLASEGRNNAMLYRLMLEAGLRLNEARCLKWADLDLDAKTMRLRSETTKNGKSETLPIAPPLLAALDYRKRELKPTGAASVVKITSRALKILNDDLTAAGIDKKDAAGRTVDLHALRHTFGTRLMRNGADVKTIQALMRHSTAAMTLGVYVHKDKGQMAAAVDCFPTIAPTQDNAAAALKTGTDDTPAAFEENPPRNRQEIISNTVKDCNNNTLQNRAIGSGSLKVTGSIPVSSTQETP